MERAPEPVAAPAPAPVITPRAAPQPAPAPADTRELLKDSGLVMIETASKPAAPVVEEPAAPLGRPRRERAKPAEEPLQQVETKN